MRRRAHLTLAECEDIMILRREGGRITEIAAAIGRDKSTVSRELARNSCRRFYRASTAQARYERRRKACRRSRILDGEKIFSLVRDKFLKERRSPEQIEGRLALELGASPVSDSAVCRGIAQGRFDGCIGGRKASRRLRRKGKRRRVPGAAGGACLVANVDRRSGYLVGGKAAKKVSAQVNEVMIASLAGMPPATATPDCGKEFAAHAEVTTALGVEFYFARPHHPWQRGCNENANGLLREYFPKGRPVDGFTDGQVQKVYDKLNRRPRKRLGYRTPYEVMFSTELQLI